MEEHAALATLRTVTITVYALSRALQDWSWNKIPFFLSAVAFLSALPSSPSAHDASYIIILVALSLHILELHLPSPPSPLHLFPFEQALPLAALIWKGCTTMYTPILALFLPTILLVFFLLSLSLSDIAAVIPLSFASASPLEARTAFLLLLVTLLFLLVCSVGMLVLVFPFVSMQTPSGSPWDRYSEPLGLDARRAFVRIVLAYTSPFASRTFQHLSDSLRSSAGSPVSSSSRRVGAITERILWWTTVGPLPLLVVTTLLCDVFLS
jgi:hypothetical protein